MKKAKEKQGVDSQGLPLGAITHLTVCGYKSLYTKKEVELRPLTILAGANSSGKSSLMQPFLLLKQTLEAPYDPGPLLLNGPNASLTSVEQILPKNGAKPRANEFSIGFGFADERRFEQFFSANPAQGIELDRQVWNGQVEFREGMPKEAVVQNIEHFLKLFVEKVLGRGAKDLEWTVIRDRCFINIAIVVNQTPIHGFMPYHNLLINYTQRIIHIPGLRGNPKRNYPTTAVGDRFPGTFENYVASVILHWQASKSEKIAELSNALAELGLTWKVEATRLDDTQVELKVGRLPKRAKGGQRDLVSIADVGFGVSQVMPVVVALLVAKPGQLVYIEQPELHLHPRAQAGLAKVLCDAAKRGVQIVIETHSALLITSIQTLVAEDYIDPKYVKLHWFKRQQDGSTEITSADLDSAGAYGDWPEDFAEVALESDSRYLDAAENRLRTAKHGD